MVSKTGLVTSTYPLQYIIHQYELEELEDIDLPKGRKQSEWSLRSLSLSPDLTLAD